MNRETRLTLHKGTAASIALALVLAGAGAAYLVLRKPQAADSTTHLPAAHSGARSSEVGRHAAEPAVAGGPLPDVVVPLGVEAAERARIRTARVASGQPAGELRLPGVVEPNAYRQVTVTPLVAGRVTRVSAELGDTVRRGRTLAQIYSPELAEAQTRYVSALARLEAHERERERTEKLVAIGAASRQELERIRAEHAAQTADVQSARSQLELFGMSRSAVDTLAAGRRVDATTSVPAPLDGVVTERTANVGLNVDPSSALFTIVDLSTVWVIADVYEKDFSRVRVGSEVRVTTAAYPDLSLQGRVSYIDPQVASATRTARVRVEVPNPRGELRLGMYAEVVVAGATGAAVALIPRGAVQNVGDRTVVYLVAPDGRGEFIEREVQLGESSGPLVEVASGVEPGDEVVVEGSFFIRAERERLGLRPQGADTQQARVLVQEQGFAPAQVPLRAGVPARLTFLRTTDATCATEVLLPALNLKRVLPLNEPVQIDFIPAKSGEITFTCGMDMLRGTLVVR